MSQIAPIPHSFELLHRRTFDSGNSGIALPSAVLLLPVLAESLACSASPAESPPLTNPKVPTAATIASTTTALPPQPKLVSKQAVCAPAIGSL